jgi:Kef-type K+ transport system membrane component KefB
MPFGILKGDAAPGELLMVLAVMWLLAKVGTELCYRLHLPGVVGELGAGLLLAVLAKQFPGIVPAPVAYPVMEYLAEIGIVVLMFAVGLESTVPQMVRVGLPSLRVAILGVILPMALGVLGGRLFLPSASWVLGLFIGACLCATSISITAQVLGEQNASQTLEGRVILGAAVLDDVLGLLVLVFVTGLVGVAGSKAGLPWGDLARTFGLALGFLALAFTLGRFVTPHLFHLADRFRSEQVLLPLGLGFAFLLAWLGSLAGMATILGAYAAGLILEPAHIKHLEDREFHQLQDLLHPLVVSLSPLFFVLMGAKIDPSALLAPKALLLALGFAVLGVIGKFAAGYGAGKSLRGAVVGWGMVPRGEVGLIFVAAGSHLKLGGQPLLDPQVQAGIVGAILLTTMAGPIGLGRVLKPSLEAPGRQG